MLLALAATLPVFASPTLFCPVTLKPGALNEVYGWDAAAAPVFSVELKRADGTLLARARSFDLPEGGSGAVGLHVAAAFVAFDVLTKPGKGLLRFLDEAGRELGRQEVTLTTRTLVEEHLALNKDMSTLRAVPDPRKNREAAQIWKVYQTIHGQDLWTQGRFHLPVSGIPTSGAFGDVRRYDYSDGTSAADYHRGTDFAAPVGTQVRAPAAGLVALAADRMLTGGTLVVEHAPGLYSVYFHLSALKVHVGDHVKPGDLIALSGKTGMVTGPHLHWEFRYNGIPVDALDLVTDGVLDTDRIGELISSIERKRG
jgi:murein DD-endopeptidase MepM/ murein hydrolase activator NlpD